MNMVVLFPPAIRRLAVILALGIAGLAPADAGPLAAAPPADVDVALILAADVSQSMDAGELALQRNGYSDALLSEEVLSAIRYGRNKRIAVVYFEWGSADRQVVVAPWTIIDGPESARAFSQKVRTAPGNSLERTAIGAALMFAGRLFDEGAPRAARQVIDISGDGPSNQGVSVASARDALTGRGITINGLPILPKPGEWSSAMPPLDAYYEDCVIGGLGAFALPTDGMESFASALRTKLVLEIAGIPQTLPRVMRAGAVRKPVDCREFD